MVGILGFEPSLTVSETVVRPITLYPYSIMEAPLGTAPRPTGSKPVVLLLYDRANIC